MKKTYIMPNTLYVVLDNESSLMSASTDAAGNNLNNMTIDPNGDGGSSQLTRQQSPWDNWNE